MKKNLLRCSMAGLIAAGALFAGGPAQAAQGYGASQAPVPEPDPIVTIDPIEMTPIPVPVPSRTPAPKITPSPAQTASPMPTTSGGATPEPAPSETESADGSVDAEPAGAFEDAAPLYVGAGVMLALAAGALVFVNRKRIFKKAG